MSSSASTSYSVRNRDTEYFPSYSERTLDSTAVPVPISRLGFLGWIVRNILVIMFIVFYLRSMAFIATHGLHHPPTLDEEHRANHRFGQAEDEVIQLSQAQPTCTVSTERSFMMLFSHFLVAHIARQHRLFIWTASLQAFPTVFGQSLNNSTISAPLSLKEIVARQLRDTAALSHAEVLCLVVLLLGLIFLPLSGTIRRRRPVVLLAACLFNLQVVLAESGRISTTSRTIRENRRVGSAVVRAPSLSSEIESFVLNLFLLLFLLSTAAVIELSLQSLTMALTIMVPFLSVAFALKSFANFSLIAQEASNIQSQDSSTMSSWVIILSLIVLVWSSVNRPHNVRLYLLACLTTICLGIGQSKLATRLSLEYSWPSRIINTTIVASHLALWVLHLIDAMGIHSLLESLLPALFGLAALMALSTQEASVTSHLGYISNTSTTEIAPHKMTVVGSALGIRELWPLALVGLGILLLLRMRAYDTVLVLLAAIAGTWHILIQQKSKLIEKPIATITSTEVKLGDFQKYITVVNMGRWVATVVILVFVCLALFRRYQFQAFFPYVFAPVLMFLAKTMIYQAEVAGSHHVQNGWNVFKSNPVPSTTVLFNLTFGLAILMSRLFGRWITFVCCIAILSTILLHTHF